MQKKADAWADEVRANPVIVLRPWDRLAAEGEVEYAAFLAYLEVRDLAALDGWRHASTHPEWSLQRVRSEAWLREYRWPARAAAWDRAQQRKDRGETDLTAEHQRLLREYSEIIDLEIGKLLLRARDPTEPALTVRELQKGLDLLIRSQRLLAGQAGDIVRVEDDTQWDLDRLSTEELLTLERLRRKALSKD